MSAPAISVGDSLGRFRIEGSLGSGGMGDVYKAVDSRLGRTVALKVLPAHLTQQPDRLCRFEQEAHAASALNHPNIVTIYDAGTHGDIPWIAMEYVQGNTLRSLLRDGPIQPKQLEQFAGQIASALTAAHEAGIVHRDLKPENVMLTNAGAIKILDFGLAKLTRPEPALQSDETRTLLTAPGDIFGTAGYMAPEQLRGQPVDHRVDQFALGVMLYEMAAGRHPFRRDSTAGTTAATLEEQPNFDALARCGTATALTNVIARCLAKKPEGRYESTRDLLLALEGAGPAVEHPHAGAGSITKRRAAIGVAFAAVIVAVAATALWRSQKTPAVPEMPVVAVRPFANLSGDTAQEQFTSGISEELRSQLSKISSIRLLSRSAVERYTGAESRKLASELGVNQIVDGSVRIHSGKLRVSVQLVDARTEQAIWSEQYDRRLEDILEVQSDVAKRVAGAMQAKLTPAERQRVGKRPTENLAAYDLYLQARKLGGRRPDTLAKSVSLLKQAIDMDPRFTEAMAELGYRLAWFANAKDTDEAKGWAERALAIDPDSAQAHHTLSLVYAGQGYFNKSRLALVRTLEADPNRAAAMSDLSLMFMATGSLEEALHWARRGLERDPLREASYYHVLNTLVTIGRRDAIERWYATWKERFPKSHRQVSSGFWFMIVRGEHDRALQQGRQLYKETPNKETLQIVGDLALTARAPDAEALFKELHGDALDAPFIQFWMYPQSPRLRYAWFALQRGDQSTAQRLLAHAEEVALKRWTAGVDTSILPVELATIYSLRKQPAKAMEWLNRAHDQGWRESDMLKFDPLLADVRNDRAFQKLVERIESEKRRIGEESAEIRHLLEKTLPTLPPVPKPPAAGR